nr:glycosyltransferase family A protein [Stagnihabitans tardus]
MTCITTVFNEGPLLLTSVRSILGQSMEDFELILVDDGSGPETLAVLEGLTDPRIRVIRQANDGLSSARNRALEQAKGEYICFLDADDSRPNWAFAAVARVIAERAPDLILTPGVLQEVRGEVSAFYDQPVFDAIAQALPAGHLTRQTPDASRLRALAQRIEPQSANKFVSRDFLRRARLGFPNGHFFEDIFFHTGVVTLAESIAFLDAPSFCYYRRYLRPQITASTGELRMDAIAVARLTLDSFAKRPEFADPLHRGAVLVSVLRILAWCAHEIGYPQRPAFRLASRAMLRLIDKGWLDLPWLQDPALTPSELGDVTAARRFLSGLERQA